MKIFQTCAVVGGLAVAVLTGSPVWAQNPGLDNRIAPIAMLKWREVGPAVIGGRISDIAVDHTDTRVIFIGTATAGVWKSSNHGTTWEAIFTDESTSSIGDVTLAPSNPNVVWVGTGEPQNRQSSPWGDGLFKSVDGGRTWTHKGLRETRHISRIQIHPRNPDVAYVAAVGNLWQASSERGVYKTTDGGDTWEQVLFVDDYTGVIDLVMDPGDPNTLFAAMYGRQRTAWGFNGGSPGSGIYRTMDGGGSWTRLEQGLPEGDLGRIGLDIYRRDGNRVYATVEARRGQTGVYGSTDRGETWGKLSDTNPRPMYFSQIRVDPNNPERIYLGGQNLMRSDDGGRTFTDEGARNVHLDHHALWIDPNDSNHLILGSDGGVSTSFDGSESWRFYDNLPIAQFYEVGYDNRNPYWVCGGLQDNGSWCGPSNTLDSQGIRNADWQNIGGGDGFYVQIDPEDPYVLYAESQNGRVGRLDLVTGERVSIAPQPRFEFDEGSRPKRDHDGEDEPSVEDREYRYNWNTPFLISSHDRSTLYVGSQMLLKSTDRGETWNQISADMTFDIDRSQLPIMDVLPTDSMLSRHDGVSFYSTLTTVGESPLNDSVLYTGSDDGRVMVTKDGGGTWSDVTMNIPDLPDNTYVSRIVASGDQEGRVYATFDGHYSGDFAAYVYTSGNFGEDWRPITNGLPESSVNILAEHPDIARLLFVGNEVGVFVSIDGGENWQPLMNGLPTVPVDDIKIHPVHNDLIIGTHGRGIWIMDNVTPLEELAGGSVMVSNPYLFRGGQAVEWREFNIQEWTGFGEFRLPNPPNGARIRYWIPEAVEHQGEGGGSQNRSGQAKREADLYTNADDSLEIKILTATGQNIRTLNGPAIPGAHEVAWDFRIDPAYQEEPGQPGSRFRGGPRAQGPKVIPGIYQIQIDVGQTTMFSDLIVRMDPRIEVSDTDLRDRQTALMAVYKLQAPIYHAGKAVSRIREQLVDIKQMLRETDEEFEDLNREAEEIGDELEKIDRDLSALPLGSTQALESSTTRPTEDQLQDVERLWTDTPGVIERINQLISGQMPAFYRRLDNEGIRTDPGEAIIIPRRGTD